MLRSIALALCVVLAGACGFHGDAPGGPIDGASPPHLDALDSGSSGGSGSDGATPGSDASATSDRDGDGIVDSADDCPDDADPLQLDHDHDGHGDVCDHCPHLASAADPDGDGDGVGDACDPHPATPNDRRALWIGFYDSDAATVMAWSTTGGAWAVTNGYVQSPPASAGKSFLFLPPTFQRAFVMTKMRLDTFSDPNAAGAIVEGVSGTTAFAQCALGKNNPNPIIDAETYAAGVKTDEQTAAWSGTLTPPGEIAIASQIANSKLECSFDSATVDATIIAAPGQIELGAQKARLSFDYVFVVEDGG